MKILFIEWASYGNEDMKEAFRREGHSLVCFPFFNKDARNDESAVAGLPALIKKETPDVVFSFNYFPVVSNVCHKENLRYISWIYDSPYVMLYSYTAIHPCNTIYVFDKAVYQEFHKAGIPTVHYLPMAANTERLDALTSQAAPAEGRRFLYDISFIGSLYTEKHNFFERMENLSDYTKGYLDALMSAQMNVQGYNFIQETISPIIEDLYRSLPITPNPDGVETKEYLYAQYVINRKITGLERNDLIRTISEKYPFDLFTHDPSRPYQPRPRQQLPGNAPRLPAKQNQSEYLFAQYPEWHSTAGFRYYGKRRLPAQQLPE